MKTLEEARAKAFALLAHSGSEVRLEIIDSATREFDVGWVFFYQSERYLESGDFQDILAGNAPVFVPKENHPASTVAYRRPLEESMDAYRASGNPNAVLQPRIALTGVSSPAGLSEGIKLLHSQAAMGMKDAKEVLETCRSGQRCQVGVGSVAEAQILISALIKAGFHAEPVYG